MKEIVVFSQNPKDLALAEQLSAEKAPHIASSAAEAEAKASENEGSVVLWDANQLPMPKEVAPAQLIAVTDGPLYQQPKLIQHAPFRHHLVRRYGKDFAEVFGTVLRANLGSAQLGLKTLLPESSSVSSTSLQKLPQKSVTVEAIRDILATEMRLPDRLARLAARALDEVSTQILMSRQGTSVSIEFGESAHCLGVSVVDPTGGLRKEKVIQLFENAAAGADASSDPGLASVIQLGLSMIFVTVPGRTSQVSFLFPRVTNMREFRTSFQFTSFLLD